MRNTLLSVASALALGMNAGGFSDYQDDYSSPNMSQTTEESCDPWYFTIGSGYAWSNNVDMQNTGLNWSPAAQGYNSNLNNGSFVSLAFGKTVYDWFDFESEMQVYQTFHYQKYQTEANSDFLTSRYRIFDLDNFTWLFNLRIHLPESWEWETGWFNIGPFIGGGVGVGVNTVSNFHTVGYSTAAGQGIDTAVGQVIRRNSFAWQANGGLYIRPPKSGVTFNFAYRYVDAGTFNGPTSVMDNTPSGNGNIISVPEWSGHFRTNQFYFFVKLEV